MKRIGQGAHSVAYKTTAPEQGEIVIKQSTSDNPSGYIKRQITGYNIADTIRSANPNLEITLPKLISADAEKGQLTESFISGDILTNTAYEELSENQKNKIATALARFLNTMHQMSAPQPAQESIKKMFDKSEHVKSVDDMVQIFDNEFDDQIIDILHDAEKYLLTHNTSDEVHVMTHKDLRSSNILYDSQKQSVGVIDFEMASIDNIYRDFIPYAPNSITSWDLTQRTISIYNKLPKKYPITIDAQKVKSAMVYGIFHELARCAYNAKQKNPDEKMNPRVKVEIQRKIAALFPPKKKQFDNATAKIPKNMLNFGLLIPTKNNEL